MKILIVGLVKSPQLLRLQEEGVKRGHVLDGVYATELVLSAQKGSFTPSMRGKDLSQYDLIYLWATGKRRWEWYTACLYLNKTYKTKIVNYKVIDPEHHYFMTPAIDYMFQVENDLPFPKSSIIFGHKSVESVIAEYEFPIILKTSLGRQGKGVFKIESVDELVAKVKELEEVSPSVVIREFIPNDGDIRIFTVGYKAIGAMKRTPSTMDEFRSNISQGGTGSVFDLDEHPQIKDIAEKASRVMRTEIAGVDIMLHNATGEPYILEINPGPQFTGFELYTKVNAAEEIIKYFESL